MALTKYQNTSVGGRRLGTEQAGLIPVQTPGKLDLLNDNTSAFNLFLSKHKKRPSVGSYTFIYHEDEYVKVTTTAAGALASGGTALVVASGDGELIAPWDILYIPRTGERVQAQEYAADDTITIKRAIDAGNSAAAIQSGDEIWILGNAMEEGTGVPNFKSTAPNAITNYIQKIITPVILTEDAEYSDNYYTKDELRQWRKAGKEHVRKLDLTFMKNGAPKLQDSDTSNLTIANGAYPAAKGNQFGLTGGFLYWHETYADADHFVTDNDVVELDFHDYLARAFQAELGKGSDEKICLCPQALTTGILGWNISRTRFWNSRQMAGSKDAIPGLKFSRYESPDGIVDFIRYWPFETTVAGGENTFCIIDKDRIGYTTFKKIQAMQRVRRDVTKNGDQITVGYYESMPGTIFQHPNVHVTVKFQTVS